MIKAADEFYAELQKSAPTADESGDAQSAAEDLAEAENRRLITLDV